MLTPELLRMVVCPQSRRPLHAADQRLIARINEAIRAGSLCDRSGQQLSRPIDAALVRDDGEMMYPVIDGIPNLLVDRAIERTALERSSSGPS
jgi:uncharacterized protein YbaR (Trm112 family)